MSHPQDDLFVGAPIAIRVGGKIVDATIVEVVESTIHDVNTYIARIGDVTRSIYADEVLTLSAA